LLDACHWHGVLLDAYSPLDTGALPSAPVIAAFAAPVGRTPAQMLLCRCARRDVPALSKSTHRDRIAENNRFFDFDLAGEELSQLDAPRPHRPYRKRS
jgi:diketogulonate reductase-like aldo/keto reductase